MLGMMMTLRNNSGTSPSSPNPPAVVYRDVAVAGGAPLPPAIYTLFYTILLFTLFYYYYTALPIFLLNPIPDCPTAPNYIKMK